MAMPTCAPEYSLQVKNFMHVNEIKYYKKYVLDVFLKVYMLQAGMHTDAELSYMQAKSQ